MYCQRTRVILSGSVLYQILMMCIGFESYRILSTEPMKEIKTFLFMCNI